MVSGGHGLDLKRSDAEHDHYAGCLGAVGASADGGVAEVCRDCWVAEVASLRVMSRLTGWEVWG